MRVCDPPEHQSFVEVELRPRGLVQLGRPKGAALWVKGHQTLVEEGVEVGAEEEAIEDVETLLVGLAFGPGFSVAGAEEFGNGDASDGAGAAPVVQQGGAEEVLASALFDEGQDFSRTGRIGFELGDFGGVFLSGLVRQGHRQFSRTAEQTAQGGFVIGLEGVFAEVLFWHATGEFGGRWALGEGHLPDHGSIRRCDVGLGLVPCGEHHHALERALADVLPAVGVTGFFDEGAFEGVHR